jgi:hypothetical protein
LLSVVVVLAMAGLEGEAWSEAAQPGRLLPLSDRVFEFVRTYQVLFGGALGAGLGYLIKWFFDQRSAERSARRQFAQSVTAQISELAKNHYWSLANCAGVLAGLLESYLDMRTYHLLLLWAERKDLERRLEEIANECAEASFFHFCRLIGLFDTFQFQGSNTYLLTSHAAGETSKRLYNSFIACLPGDDEDRIETLKIVKVLREERKTKLSSAPVPVSQLPSFQFMEEIARKDLQDELERYSRWIKNRVPDVEEAADALRAYNELLNRELACLYRDFFKKTPADAESYLGEVAFDDWPNLLTEQSYHAIKRASVQSALLRPLGAPRSAGQPSSGKALPEEKQDEAGKCRPQKAGAPASPEGAQRQAKEDSAARKWDATIGRRFRHMVEEAGTTGSSESLPTIGRLLRHMVEEAGTTGSSESLPGDSLAGDTGGVSG